MRHALRRGTWKRLTFALALAAAVLTGLIAPVSSGHAIPPPANCGSNQSTIIIYYSSSTYQNATCQDVLYACPGFSPTSFCRTSKTPWFRTVCSTCYPN